MVQKERDKQPIERRLLRARDHVNNFWFPVNGELHQKIRASIKEGTYKEANSIISDVRGDFSLFMFCIREVAAMLKEEGHELPLTQHPIELLEWAGVERLKSIVDIDTQKISPHTLSNLHPFQKSQLEESLISSVSSQVLSQKLGIDPEIAFTTSLLRHLGYALVAWNYANVYHQALLSVRPTDPLDAVITRLLGFSPSSLAISIVTEWGLAPYIQNAIRLQDEEEISGIHNAESIAITKSLLHICKVSEALARANNPSIHATAKKDWAFARKEIQKTLGEKGVEIISNKLLEAASSYIELTPQVFKGAFMLDPVAHLRRPGVAYEPNPYIARCSDKLKADLSLLYASMSVDEVSTVIRTLVRDIVPNSQFSKGCVYTVDPGVGWLLPQLGIGGTNVSALKPRNASQEDPETDVIIRAFNSADLITGSTLDADNPHSFLARCIGNSQRYGVLYLETPQMINEMLRNKTRDEFNAIALTLTDCLSLI